MGEDRHKPDGTNYRQDYLGVGISVHETNYGIRLEQEMPGDKEVICMAMHDVGKLITFLVMAGFDFTPYLKQLCGDKDGLQGD